MSQTISDYESFKTAIVDVDFQEFQRNSGDLRGAFHCAISLFHLCDWVYVAHKTAIDKTFSFSAGGKSYPVHNEGTFANALADLHPDFELIRGVANSAKHLVLTSTGGSRPRPAHTPSHAANTQSVSYGAIGDAAIGAGPIGGWTDVELEGANRKMIDIARSVHSIWERLFNQYGW